MIAKIKNFFLTFSVIFFIAAVTSFTAFNWKIMTNFQKLAIPSVLIITGLAKYIFFKKDIYKNLALFFSCFAIGTLFAVYGQIYQTGADSWTLFRNWTFFLIVPTILTMSYSLFLLLIVVSSLMTYFYLGLYYETDVAFYISTMIAGFIVGIYPFIVEKFKIKFNNLFYNSLVIPFYIFFNISGIFIIFSRSSYYLETVDTLKTILGFSYLLIIGLLFVVAYKIYKRNIILPFSIVSAGLSIWSWMVSTYFRFSFFWDSIPFFLISLIIFIGTLTTLLKSFSFNENEFTKKIVGGIGNFLKFFIYLFGLGLLFSLGILSNIGVVGFLIIGIMLIALSCYFPKILGFKENKLEIISFAIGLISLITFFNDILDYPDTIVLATFLIVMFDVFWFIRPNRAMDLLFAPVHYAYILVFLTKFNFIFFFVNNTRLDTLNINLLSIIGVLVVLLQLIFNKKISSLDNNKKDKINRIFYGNNTILLIFLLLSDDFLYSFYYFQEDITMDIYIKIEFYLRLIRTILIIAISVFVATLSLIDKKKLAISNNSEIQSSRNYELKDIIIFSVLILIIQIFARYIPGVNIIILLILLYIYKNYKWTPYLLNLILVGRIFYYYYSLFYITLLEKSLHMFIIGVVLIVAYLVLKYFVKEASVDENKN